MTSFRQLFIIDRFLSLIRHIFIALKLGVWQRGLKAFHPNITQIMITSKCDGYLTLVLSRGAIRYHTTWLHLLKARSWWEFWELTASIFWSGQRRDRLIVEPMMGKYIFVASWTIGFPGGCLKETKNNIRGLSILTSDAGGFWKYFWWTLPPFLLSQY